MGDTLLTDILLEFFPDFRTENLRSQTLGNPPGRTLGVSERLGQRVHLVDSHPARRGGEMTLPHPAPGPVPIPYPHCARCSHTWHGLPCPVLTPTKTTPTCACPTSIPARIGAGGLHVPSTM